MDERDSNLTLMAGIFARRRDAVTKAEEVQFYNLLIGACLATADNNLSDTDYETFPEIVLNYIVKHHQHFSEVTLNDARQQVMAIIAPSAVANPHLTIEEKSLAHVDPELLIKAVEIFKLEEQLANAIPNLPQKFSEVFDKRLDLGVVALKKRMVRLVETSDDERKRKFFDQLLQAFNKGETDRRGSARHVNSAVSLFLKHHDYYLDNPDVIKELKESLYVLEPLSKEVKALTRTGMQREYIQHLFNEGNPFDIFRTVHLIGLAQGFEQNIADAVIPPPIRKMYAVWKGKEAEFIQSCAERQQSAAIEQAPQAIEATATSAEVTGVVEVAPAAVETASSLDKNSNRNVFENMIAERDAAVAGTYRDICDAIIIGMKASEEVKGSAADFAAKSKEFVPPIFRMASQNFDEYSLEQKKLIRFHLSCFMLIPFLTTLEELRQSKRHDDYKMTRVTLKVITDANIQAAQDSYFDCMYLYDFADDLKTLVGHGHIYGESKKAYERWKSKRTDFITACVAGEKTKAVELLNPSTAAEPAPQAESITAPEVNTQVLLTSQRELEFYKSKRDSAANASVRKLYDLLYKTIQPLQKKMDRAALQEAYDAHPKLVHLASDKYDDFSIADRIELRKQLRVYITNGEGETQNQLDDTARKVLKSVPPHILFRVVHLYDLVADFENSCQARLIPTNLRFAYSAWATKNAAFIDDCEVAHFLMNDEIQSGAVDVAAAYASPAGEKVTSVRDRYTAQELYRVRRAKAIQDNDPITAKLYAKILFLLDYQPIEANAESHKKAVHKLTDLIQFAEENFLKLPATAVEDSHYFFGAFFFQQHKMGEGGKSIVNEAIAATPTKVLFRLVAQYGMAKQFTSYDLIDAGLKNRFKNWVEQNDQFARDCVDVFKVLPGISSLTDLRDAAQNPEEKKFYEICRGYLTLGLARGKKITFDDNIVSADEINTFVSNPVTRLKFLVANQNYLDEKLWDEIELLSVSVISLRVTELDSNTHPLHVLPETEVFAYVRMAKIDQYFCGILDEAHFPNITADDYKRWCENPEGYEPRKAIPQAANDNPPAPGLTDSRVTYIDVEHPLVARRNREEGMGYRPVDEGEQLEVSKSDGSKDQNRTKKLEDALLLNDEVKHLYIHRDIRKVDRKSAKPYNLIDVEMQDGSRSRIAVCNYAGNMTLVERDAPEYIENTILDLELVRKNPKTWHVVHISDRQWIEGIQEVLYTPLDQMKPALKSRSYWYSLGDVAVQTLATKFMIAGRAPSTMNTGLLIDCGPLEGRSKFNLLYSAWHRGSIKDWDKGTTFSIVLKALTEGKDGHPAPMPWLKKFESKPQLTADSIIAASEKFVRHWNMAVKPWAYDEVKIDGLDVRANPEAPDLRRTGLEADIALKFKAVSISPDKLEKWGRYPRDLEDLVSLAGINSYLERSVA